MVSAFTRLPIPPLPERALGSTDALYEWAQPLMLRTWGQPYWDQVYFFLAFKIALTLVSSLFMLRLLKLGHFWVFRPVRVRRGTILVPKATDAVIFLGACFISVDAAYRIQALRFFRGPTYAPIKGFFIMEGLRLSPAWLAAWVHLCASSLVWPLQIDRLHPALWHLGFLGVPVLFFASFVPTMVVADRWVDKAQIVYLALEKELLAAPGAPLTQSMKDQALLFHSHWNEAGYYCGYWAVIGGLWVLLVLVGELVVGTTLLSRVYKSYSQIPVDTSTHHTWSTLDASVNGSLAGHAEAELRPPSPPQLQEKHRIGPLRMAKYLAGVAPLASTAPEKLDPLPPATVRRILRTFFLHTLLELFSLCSLLIVIFAVVMYMAASCSIEMRENVPDQRYGNTFVRTTVKFHIVELWAVVLFGSLLIISMLKRQAYPLHVQTTPRKSKWDVRRRQDPTSASTVVGQPGFKVQRDGEDDDADSTASSNLRHKRTFSSNLRVTRPSNASDGPLSPNTMINEWPSTRADSTASDRPLTDKTRSVRRTGEAMAISPSDEGGFERSPTPGPAREQDVSWYAGHSAGRSIVLEALASGSDVSPRGRKAAWRTNYTDSPNPDMERTGAASPTQMFATPHGIIGGAAMPLQDLASPPTTPRSPSHFNPKFTFSPAAPQPKFSFTPAPR